MNDPKDLNLGDIFNARDLTAGDVAGSFVAPPFFRRLLSQAHCILEGPRGSGKTTLLRMLTPESFALWNGPPDAKIQFIGVFVPADVRWAKQLKSRLDRISDALAREVVQQAVFSVAVNLALVDTIVLCTNQAAKYGKEHPDLFFSISRETQASVVSALSKIWRLPIDVPSFNGLRLALRIRQHELGDIALNLANGIPLGKMHEAYPYVASLWLDNIVGAVDTLNDLIERPQQRWAILLDELEIIPKQLLRSIVEAIRSTSPNLRFKLALSPTGSDLIQLAETSAPTPSNDYRPIPLWYETRDEARIFSEKLFSSALIRMAKLDKEEHLENALSLNSNSTADDGVEAALISSLNQGNNSHRERISAFVSLYAKDESFKKILDSKNIDPNSPPISDSSEVGTFVRKITPLVYLRDREIERFDYASGRTVHRGGRRAFQPYIGYPNLIDLTEGNPRWILTLIEGLVAESGDSSHGIGKPGVQARAVDEFVEQFVSKLMVYPTETNNTNLQTHITPFRFIELLGASIATSLYDGPFSSDPALSFTIDKQAMSQYGDYIKTCIDLGALVIMRKDSTAPLGADTDGLNLVGSRVRITYRLAPRFRLPLRAEKERKISNALKTGELLSYTGAVDSGLSREKISAYPIQGRLL
jgi:hypothetical protein